MAKDTKGGSKPQSATPAPIGFYLVAYNALSAAGWGYVLALVIIHLFNLDGQSDSFVAAKAAASSGVFSRVATYLGAQAGALSVKGLCQHIPASVKPILARAATAHARAGAATTFVQSFAILEVVHAALGWVRSPVVTTAMQVASRLFLVWGILDRFPEVHSSPLFASMVFAWSFTEVIRYTFYALNLVGLNPRFLLWLRYTTFYVLYPLGAGSEAFITFATLPNSHPSEGKWALWDFGRAFLFTIWWPGLYIMYTYMISQRRKVLGPAKAPKTKTK